MGKSYQQFAIVTGDTAQQLTDRLNEKLIELREKDPVVSFDGMIARIAYTERAPETMVDDYEARGVNLTCRDCPFYNPIYKSDGSIDRRVKYGECRFAQYGRTFPESAACKTLFLKLNSGEVQLCLPEQE